MTLCRIEAMGRSLNLDQGVKARVADPFWMLGRQWQVGEFRGDDASQPVRIDMAVETVPITSFRSGKASPQPVMWGQGTKSPSAPLEMLAEQMPSTGAGYAGIYAVAQAGEALAQDYDAAGLQELTAVLRADFGFLDLSPDLAGSPRLKAAVRMLIRRGIDARRVAADIDEKMKSAINRLPRRRQQKSANALLKGWRAAQTPVEASGWSPTRMEYDFSIAATSEKEEAVLSASEHVGGALDWFDFDFGGAPHGIADGEDLTKAYQVTAMPTPVSYAGMPAARWWEMEDRAVHMGDVQSGPGDFGRLMVAEFATSYSDDWFMVPLRVPRGTLARVTSISVRTNFGQRGNNILFGPQTPAIKHAAVLDAADAGARARSFQLFEIAGDPGPERGQSPWLFVAPVAESSQLSPPMEQVELARDEAANLAWAIERRVEGPLGRPMDRGRAWFSGQEEGAPTSPAPVAHYGSDDWRYELAAEMPPPWWIPFMPERLEGSRQTRLRRGRMRAWEDMPPGLTGAVGGLLGAGSSPFYLEEEEVPRSGATVTRRWQVCRGQDGALHLWLTHEKRPGRGERTSGLRWDILHR